MVRSYLDISTGHLKGENQNKILTTKSTIFRTADIGIYGYPYREGSFISIAELDENDLESLSRTGYDELANILKYCIDNDISLIRFDADAPHMEEFEVFDW